MRYFLSTKTNRYFLFFLLFFFSCKIASAYDENITLNQEELEYIRDNPIIRVQVANDWAPFNYIKQEKASGYVNDYMRLLADRAGFKLNFVEGKSWTEYMEMLANNELECISNMTVTEKRKGNYLFSRNVVVDVFNGLLTRNDEQQQGNIETFQNRVIAVARGYSQQELLTTYYPDIKLLPTDNLLDAIREVIAGRADAALGAHSVFSYYINKYLLTDVRSTPLIANNLFPSAPHYIAVNLKNKVLISILDKAAATITPQETKQLQEQWFITSSRKEKIHLSEAEHLYLQEKEELLICVDPDWMPMDKIEGGEHLGLAAEYMKLFAQKIATPITLYPTKSWKETIEAAKTRKCDFISMAVSTPERRKHFLFSQPYLTSPLVMATRSEIGFMAGITGADGELVGVTKDYAFADDLARKYPNIDFVTVQSIGKGLAMVREGELFGYVDSLLALAYTIQKRYTGELKIATEANLRLKLSMAIRNDQPELLNIFNKAILSLSNSDHQQILNKWISVTYEESTNYRLVFQILTGVVLLFGILLYRHYTLRKLNRKLQFQNLEIRKHTEALKSTQEQLLMTQHAVDSCAFPIFWISLEKETKETKVVHANAQAAETLGYSLEEFLTLNVEDVIEAERSTSPLLFNGVRSGQNARSSISRFKRKDGTFLSVEMYISSFKYDEIYCKFVFFKDISQRLEMEARLHRSMKMEAIGMMAGGVAHDLNNILSGVVSYPEILLRQLPEDNQLRKPLENIHKAGMRAAEVVADLLTVARGVASEKVLGNLNSIVDDYLVSPEFHKLKSQFPKVIFDSHFADPLLNLICSEIHVKKALMNLVINAAEAVIEDGTVVITTANCTLEKCVINHQSLATGVYVLLTVKDGGPGISSFDLEHIFEPFYSKKILGSSGTGLGLPIVWNTMLDHRGAVNVVSDSSGTSFELYFPATREFLPPDIGNEDSHDLAGDGETILVVDDEPQQRDIAVQILGSLNYQVQAVESGEEAIAIIKDHSVDLLILDMIMRPGISGRETYRQVTAIHPNQKAVIVSGFSEDDDVKNTFQLGATLFLQKPYTLKQLGKMVKNALKGDSIS